MQTRDILEQIKKPAHPVVAYGLISATVLVALFAVLINASEGNGPAFFQNAQSELLAAVESAVTPHSTAFHTGEMVQVTNPAGADGLKTYTDRVVVGQEPYGGTGTVDGGPLWYQNEWWWGVNFTTNIVLEPWTSASSTIAGHGIRNVWVPETSIGALSSSTSSNPVTVTPPTPTPTPTPPPSSVPPITQVAAGCPMPSGNVGTAFYIDPVAGSDTGDGSKAHPWKTLQDVIAAGLFANMPTHYDNASKTTIKNNPNAPIKSGDTLYLMSGDQGSVVLQGSYGTTLTGYNNTDFITITAAPGQTPVIDQLDIKGASKWIFSGITFKSLNTSGTYASGGTSNPDYFLATVSGPHDNIIFNDDTFMSQANVSSWSPTDWKEKRASGLFDNGGGGGTCTTITNNTFQNVGFGIDSQRSDNVLVANNTINYFSDDGIDYSSNDMVIEGNHISNSIEDGDGFHRDGMQGQPITETTTVQNVTIKNNFVTRLADPANPYPGSLQGIDEFDGIFKNVTVEGNQVITNLSQGISFYGAQGLTIENNVVLSDNQKFLPCEPISMPNCSVQGQSVITGTTTIPTINISDAKAKTPSNNVTIMDNIVSGIGIILDTQNLNVTHNLCVPTNGKCVIGIPVNGAMLWKAAPGTYPGDNVITSLDASALFTQFDPIGLHYNLTLKVANPAL
jgi:parallel beta-helix repeat protein